jgi:IS5 family transposase
MKRPTLSDIEYGRRKRTTKRDNFLHIMNDIIPWDEWVAYIAPHYPEGERGRPPMGIEKMLRMYLACLRVLAPFFRKKGAKLTYYG